MPTAERVQEAYAALASGDPAQVAEYWAEDMRWLVPGNHAMAGWYEGRDAFLGFMEACGKRSANSFNMELITIVTNDEYSVDVTHNTGNRAGAPEGSTSPYDHLDISVGHLLRWRDGKVVEGKGGIYGDGTDRFNMFWSQLRSDETRIED